MTTTTIADIYNMIAGLPPSMPIFVRDLDGALEIPVAVTIHNDAIPVAIITTTDKVPLGPQETAQERLGKLQERQAALAERMR